MAAENMVDILVYEINGLSRPEIFQMAPGFYQKPETAIKMAEDFVAVNKHTSALNLLHEVILSKRARTTPLTTLEPIVLKFVELSVQLARGKTAREGLVQYKNIAQSTAISTIELVIKQFLELAKKQLEQAQKKANQINLAQIDDLEAGESPESLILNTMSNEDTKDRTDRQVVTPWLRFLWEAYRTALDTLRNNAKLEVLYQSVALQAFQFCLKYERKLEFRRLCETLRQHFFTAVKYANQPFAIDLNDPETLQRHLDTRFSQLNAAAELELWQEGFRSIEDIFNLLEITKKNPKLYMMANYYEKLARILMVGENQLFHSAAYFKYYSIMRQNTNLTEDDLQKMASTFLVSALAVPIIRQNSTFEEDKSKTLRLTSLLHVSQVPTREFLLQQALSKGIYSLVRPEVKELYELLEVQFHPLSICQKVAPIMKSLAANPELNRYVKSLHNIILTRLLQQLSQVYSSIKIDSVVKLTAFPAPYNYDSFAIEKFVLNGCKRGEFAIRINHSTQSLIFEPSVLSPSFDPLASLHSPIDQVRSQFTQFTQRLEKAIALMDPTIQKQKKSQVEEVLRNAAANIENDRRTILRRRQLIEIKAERRIEELALEERARQQRVIESQQAEEARLAEQEKIMAAERIEQQKKEMERAEAQKLAEKIANELREKNIKVKDSELLDTDKLIELQAQQIEKEKRELAQKSKSTMKKIDHTERAFRLAEVQLLDDDYKKQQEEDKKVHELKKNAMLDAAKAKFEMNMVIKKRVKRMLGDYKAYREKLIEERDAHYQVLIKEANEKMKAEIEARKIEVARQLEEKKKREEEERIAAEKRDIELKKKKEEEAERQRKLEEISRIQRQKELEIEEKMNCSSSSSKTNQPVEQQENKWKPGAGSWRDRKAGGATAPPSSDTSRSGQRPTPTAFSSAFGSRNREQARDDAPPTRSGPPKVGSGKWASKRNE